MVSSNDAATPCYMLDVLLYCAIIVSREGLFSDDVQFQGFKTSEKKHYEGYCFDNMVVYEWMDWVVINSVSMVKAATSIFNFIWTGNVKKVAYL